jgi:hypothetical protein
MLRYIPRYSRYYMDSTVGTTVGSVGGEVVLCCAVLCCAVHRFNTAYAAETGGKVARGVGRKMSKRPVSSVPVYPVHGEWPDGFHRSG